jgi:hypothetical protein
LSIARGEIGRRGHLEVARGRGQEELGQERDVLGPAPEWRHDQRDDRDAVVEVLAERAGGDAPPEVLTGGEDQADVDGAGDP